VLVPVIAIGAMVGYLQMREPVYRAAMTLVVGEPRGELPPVLGSSSVTRTMTNLLESDLVARSVIDTLNLDVPVKEFTEKLKVNVLPDTSVLDVTYDSTDPEVALGVISELNSIFTRELDEALGVRESAVTGTRTGSFDLIVRTFDAPHLEPEPIPAKTVQNIAFAGIASLVLGLLLAVGREALDSRVRARGDVEEWLDAPVVFELPKGLRGELPPGVGKPRSARREHRRAATFDVLRARVQFAQMGGIAGRTIAVTSAGREVGKSAVTANLGAALARAGKRVVCVDADVRRPGLNRCLGLPTDAPGLVDVIEHDVDLDAVMLHVELAQPSSNGAGPSKPKGSLDVLSAGSPPSPLVDLLTPEAIAAVTDRLLERADYVLFDAPPLLVASSFPLAIQSDNVLVVARHGRTTKGQAEAVRATLDGLGVEKVGVVLTDAPAIDGQAQAY
jgi:receptor protein-tyrosine kinase